MRRIVPICLFLLFTVLSAAGRAYGQPPDRWVPWASKAKVGFIIVDGRVVLMDVLPVDSDTGTFVEHRPGLPDQTRTVDNTVPAQEDLTFTFRSAVLEVGPVIEMRRFFLDSVRVRAAMHVGTLDLSYTDPNRAETSYESPTRVTGFSTGGSAAKYFEVSENQWARLLADLEYSADHGDEATRTPAQTGPVTSEHNEIHEDHFLTMMELAYFKRMGGRAAVSVFGGAGYLQSDVRLDRQLVLAGPPGATTDATLRTDLSKQGAVGTVGGAFYFGQRFSLSVKGSFGAQSGVTIGGAWGIW